jgi:hypothetical protein
VPSTASVNSNATFVRRFDLNFHRTRASNIPSMIARCVLPGLLAVTALFTSCRKPEVQTYRVAKEPTSSTADSAGSSDGRVASTNAPATPTAPATAEAASPAGNRMANTAVPTAAGPGLVWTAPSHWKAKPAGAMRKGSFAIEGEGGGADLSITAFPGDVGGDLANLNRWRSQIDLPPISAGEFDSAVQRVEKNGLRMTIVDLAGTGANAKRILGVMIPHEGATWFVKLTGPDALVAKEKPAFMAFLDSIKAPPAAK